jgi:hypothetical protein
VSCPFFRHFTSTIRFLLRWRRLEPTIRPNLRAVFPFDNERDSSRLKLSILARVRAPHAEHAQRFDDSESPPHKVSRPRLRRRALTFALRFISALRSSKVMFSHAFIPPLLPCTLKNFFVSRFPIPQPFQQTPIDRPALSRAKD